MENDERKFLTLLINSVYSNENLNTQKGKTDYKPNIADHLREELRDKSEEHGTMRKITENYVIPIPLTIRDKEYSLKTIGNALFNLMNWVDGSAPHHIRATDGEKISIDEFDFWK